MNSVLRLVMIIVRNHVLDFRDRDHWQETTEQQEQRGEQTEAADQHHDVDLGWSEIGPT